MKRIDSLIACLQSSARDFEGPTQIVKKWRSTPKAHSIDLHETRAISLTRIAALLMKRQTRSLGQTAGKAAANGGGHRERHGRGLYIESTSTRSDRVLAIVSREGRGSHEGRK